MKEGAERHGGSAAAEPILLSPPHLSGEEIQFLANAVNSNWIAPAGPDLDAFEEEVAELVGGAGGAGD